MFFQHEWQHNCGKVLHQRTIGWSIRLSTIKFSEECGLFRVSSVDGLSRAILELDLLVGLVLQHCISAPAYSDGSCRKE